MRRKFSVSKVTCCWWFMFMLMSLFLGVSCFRQISIDKLTNRSENDQFTRSSVQKSVGWKSFCVVYINLLIRKHLVSSIKVCCLSRLPLFGYIEVKLNIIVDKIFEQGNFDCDELLKDAYIELNRCLDSRIQDSPLTSCYGDFINDFFIETCLRELIILWVLFEYYKSPCNSH